MEDLALIKKLFNAVSKLSNEDLTRLAELFKHRNTSDAFIKMIETHISFREVMRENKMEHDVRAWKYDKMDNDHVQRNGESIEHLKYIPRKLVSKKSLWDGVSSALADKELFPTTNDVVEVIKSELHCNVKYEDFYKRGRRDLIGYCMRYLKTRPEKEQYTLLRSFFKRIIQERSGMNQYRELFRMLTSYE